jgi:hypothetical protein
VGRQAFNSLDYSPPSVSSEGDKVVLHHTSKHLRVKDIRFQAGLSNLNQRLLLPLIVFTLICVKIYILRSNARGSSHFKCDDLIFGPKRKEVAGVWGKLHDDNLHGFTLVGHMACTGEKCM